MEINSNSKQGANPYRTFQSDILSCLILPPGAVKVQLSDSRAQRLQAVSHESRAIQYSPQDHDYPRN